MDLASWHIRELLEHERWRVFVVETLGLVRLDPEAPADFARACLAEDARELSADECRQIVENHAEKLLMFVRPVDLPSLPFEKEYFHVTLVQLARKGVLSSLRPRLKKALQQDEALGEKLGGYDPAKALQVWLSEELVSGSEGRQKDLTPVTYLLKHDFKEMALGIVKVASVLGRDPSDYAKAVVAACCNPSGIPQKGLRFALTLLARAGGSNRNFVDSFQDNLELLLSEDCDREDLRTGRQTYARLSETKTVLSALQLAHVKKGKHFARPDFSPTVKDFLQTIL